MYKAGVLIITVSLLSACGDGGEIGKSDYFDTINSHQTATASAPQPVLSQPILPVEEQANITPNTDGSEYLQSVQTQSAAETSVAGDDTQPVVRLNEPALTAPTLSPKEQQRLDRAKDKGVSDTARSTAKRSVSIDLAAYGRSQQHLVGEKKYSRRASKYEAGGNCGNYTIPEIAQTAFLDAGGPRKDPLLLDRDGDGFACAWVPNR